MYIHIWRLPAQLSHGQADSIGTQPSPIKSIWEVQRHTIYLHIYIHMYRFCIVFISSLYTLSTPGRSCRLSEQLVKSHFIAPLYANAIAPLIVKSFMAFFFVIHGILLLLLLLVLILLLVLLALFLCFALTLNTLPKLH